MKKYKLILCGLSIFVLCCRPCGAFASAWTLEPGKAQLILTGAYSSADTLIDEQNEKIPLTTFTKSDSRLYLEFGLFEKLMFVGQGGYEFIKFKGAGSHVDFAGFSETKLGLQYQIKRQEGLSASILASYIIDGGLDDPRLNLGGRNDEVEIRALYGRSKEVEIGEPDHSIWFYDAQIGMRYDLKADFISRHQLDLTVGIKPSKKWMGLAQFYALNVKKQTNGFFDIPKTQQVKAELSLVYQLTAQQNIQLGVTRTLAGRNSVQETGLFTGVWRKF